MECQQQEQIAHGTMLLDARAVTQAPPCDAVVVTAAPSAQQASMAAGAWMTAWNVLDRFAAAEQKLARMLWSSRAQLARSKRAPASCARMVVAPLSASEKAA